VIGQFDGWASYDAVWCQICDESAAIRAAYVAANGSEAQAQASLPSSLHPRHPVPDTSCELDKWDYLKP
jgi:hypothetical protein